MKCRENNFDFLSVRPNITGARQVGGRNDTAYAEHVALNTEYVRNQSLRKDLEIVFKTTNAVQSDRGA